MHPYSLLGLLLLPLLASAQSSNSSSGASQNVQLSTSLSTFITLGPNRAESTGTRTVIVTVTPSGNSTTSGNSTSITTGANATTSASTTATPSNLPTAPTDINGGGGGGAPVPGATGAGGAYGPDDGYIAAANSLKRNTLAGGLVAFVIGGVFVVL